jgi:hypothetical protein
MSAQEEIPRIGEELEEARRDLRETLTQVNHKVKQTEQKLSPEHLIKDRPIVASSLAAMLGFLVGGSNAGSTIAAFAIGALLVSAFHAAPSSE